MSLPLEGNGDFVSTADKRDLNGDFVSKYYWQVVFTYKTQPRCRYGEQALDISACSFKHLQVFLLILYLSIQWVPALSLFSSPSVLLPCVFRRGVKGSVTALGWSTPFVMTIGSNLKWCLNRHRPKKIIQIWKAKFEYCGPCDQEHSQFVVSSGLEPGQQKFLGMEEKLLWSVWASFLLHDKTQLSSIRSQSAYVIDFGCQHSDASSFGNVTTGKKAGVWNQCVEKCSCLSLSCFCLYDFWSAWKQSAII